MSMTIATTGACFLAWLAVAYTLPRMVRYASNPAMRAYWIAYLLLALALTLPLSAVQPVIDHLVGLPDVSYWASDSLALASCWSMLWYLCQLNAADSVSRHVLRVIGSVTVGVIVFLMGRFIVAPGSTSTVLAPGRSAIYMALYRLAFLGALGLSARASILLLQRYRQAIPPSPLTDRLRLMSWAAYVFIAFVLFESLRTVRVVPAQVPQAVGETILLLFVLLLVLSLTTTIWGPLVQLSALLTWLDHYQDQRRLAPLWRALYPVNPGQALQSPPGTLGALLTVRDLHFRVSRQVVELRDWYLALLPYHADDALRGAEALCQHEGVPAADLSCAVEAICLLAALQRRAAGCWASIPAEWPTILVLNRTKAGLTQETAVLIRVAHYYRRYRHSPHVRLLLSQLKTTSQHDLVSQSPAQGVV